MNKNLPDPNPSIHFRQHRQLSQVECEAYLESFVRELYTQSFPIEERRAWKHLRSLLQTEQRLELYFIFVAPDSPLQAAVPVAFVTVWHLGTAYYVEHLAVAPEYRGQGLGLTIVGELLQRYPRLFLEVEPASTSAIAAQRIEFYRRAGLILSPLAYIQPPYEPSLPALALALMRSPAIREAELEALIAPLKQTVYKHFAIFTA